MSYSIKRKRPGKIFVANYNLLFSKYHTSDIHEKNVKIAAAKNFLKN